MDNPACFVHWTRLPCLSVSCCLLCSCAWLLSCTRSSLWVVWPVYCFHSHPFRPRWAPAGGSTFVAGSFALRPIGGGVSYLGALRHPFGVGTGFPLAPAASVSASLVVNLRRHLVLCQPRTRIHSTQRQPPQHRLQPESLDRSALLRRHLSREFPFTSRPRATTSARALGAIGAPSACWVRA